MSTFEKRRAKKALAKINEVELAAGAQPSVVAVQGTQKFQWSDGATVVLCLFAAAFVVALALGYIITPGGIFLVAGFSAVKPRRTISLSQSSVTVWTHGFWGGGVKDQPVGHYPRNLLQVGEWTSVPDIPPIKLKSGDHDLLRAAINELGPAPTAQVVHTPPPPMMANAPLG